MWTAFVIIATIGGSLGFIVAVAAVGINLFKSIEVNREPWWWRRQNED